MIIAQSYLYQVDRCALRYMISHNKKKYTNSYLVGTQTQNSSILNKLIEANKRQQVQHTFLELGLKKHTKMP